MNRTIAVLLALWVSPASAADKDTTYESHWMPVGMLSLRASGNYDRYGPNLRDIRITRYSDASAGNFLALNYEELTAYLRDDRNAYWTYTAEPDWDNPDWARQRVLAVGEAFETQLYDYQGAPKEYKWCSRHTPYLVTNSQNACGVDHRGIDCSNYTSFVYNFALGHRFSSNVHHQAGQDEAQVDANGNMPYPNEPAFDVAAMANLRAGEMLCLDGSLADPGCPGGVMSSFSDQYTPIDFVSEFRSGYVELMRPGDLLYFDYQADRDVDHAAIWTGTKDSAGNWLLLENTQVGTLLDDRLDNIWAVRRVVSDADGAEDYINQSFGVDHFQSHPVASLRMDCSGGPSYSGTAAALDVSFIDASGGVVANVSIEDWDNSSCSQANASRMPVAAFASSSEVRGVRIMTSSSDAFWLDRVSLAVDEFAAGRTDSQSSQWGIDDDQGWALSTDPSDGGGSWANHVPGATGYACLEFNLNSSVVVCD